MNPDIVVITNQRLKAKELYPEDILVSTISQFEIIIDRLYPEIDLIDYWDHAKSEMPDVIEKHIEVFNVYKDEYIKKHG